MGSQTDSADGYWFASQQPWASLLFLLPFLIVYEVGTLSTSAAEGMRNGADIWIRQALLDAGFRVEWIFPLLVPVILISWHYLLQKPWTCRYETLTGMFSESLLFAVALIFLGQILHAMVSVSLATGKIPQAISFLGAGIYEELLFRLMLLPLIYAGFRLILVPQRAAMLTSVIVSSLLFATAHYVETTSFLSPRELAIAAWKVANHSDQWFGYLFRLIAGILFSALFWMRGFGIAAGSHLLYDLMVGVLLSDVAAGTER